MATVTRYIDTASSGGGGTTQSHTEAYATMASWESSEQTNLVTAGDTHVVYCAGSTADVGSGTGCTVGGWTTGSGNGITIAGDPSAPDSDGKYGGTDAYSTSHYRLETSSNTFTCLMIQQGYVTLDGIQVDLTVANTTASNRRSIAISGGGGNFVMKNCRVKGTKGRGLDVLDGIATNVPSTVHNCIFSDTQYAGIYLGSDAVGSHDLNCYNNTVWNCGISGDAGIVVTTAEDFSDDTFNIYNNVVIDCSTEFSISTTSSVVNAHYNGGEGSAPTGHDSNWVTVTPSTDFENYTSYADMRPNDGGNLDNGGTTPYASTDINGSTYVTNDIGAFIAVVDAAGGDVFLDYNIDEISHGMRAVTAAGMGGVLVQ